MRRWLIETRGGSSSEAAIQKVTSDHVEVRVGDETYRLEIRRVGDSVAFVLPSGRTVTPMVGPAVDSRQEVVLNGKSLYLSELGNGATASGNAGSTQKKVCSQMPGRVVKLLVKPGDDVEKGQGLVILEAMKMENEVKAGRDGRIGSLLVSEGDRVDSGADLVEFE